MTFGVLAPYRRMHIGTVMLQAIIAFYQRKPEIKRITLHVHTSNDVALRFYQKHGFKVIDTLPTYYKRLHPTSAHLLVLQLRYDRALPF